MKLTPIFELVRIKQEIRGTSEFSSYRIASPGDAQELAVSFIADEDREVFLVMMLNTKYQVIGLQRASMGSLSTSIVYPRDVMNSDILNNAESIIVSHQATHTES